MKRFFSFLLIFLTTATFCFADSIINDIDHFSKLFPRQEGSLNEKAVLIEIGEKLDNLGIDYFETGFTETEGYHSYSSYIETEIVGNSDESLITIIPVKGSYGIAATLYLIEYFKTITPELTLKFVFLGAETSSSRNPGTRNFLEHFYPESPSAFIYFNFEKIPQSFKIVSGADGYSSPFFLFDTVMTALNSADISVFHSNTESILFRLSAAGTESMISDYLEEGYPALELSCFESCEEDMADMIDGSELIEFYTQLSGSLSGNLSSDWDSHFIFGVSEQVYIIVYIILLTVLMMYPIFKRRHFGWYMKTLVKNFWNLILLFAVIFIMLSLTSMLLTFIFSRLKFPELWKFLPVISFLFKIFFALFCFSITFKLFTKLPFSRKGSFYSISAIFILVISLFILTIINLTLSFFALWSLCFIFLFTIFRKPWIKFIMLAFSIMWLGFILFEIFTLPSYSVIKLITASPLQGDMMISLIILPFMLAGIRLEMLSPVPGKYTKFIPLVLGAASAGLLAVILFYSPFSDTKPQPVTISETINETENTRILDFDSPRMIREDVQDQLMVIASSSVEFKAGMEFDLNSKSFLSRKIINISINFASQPEQISLILNTDKPLTLYESNYPAQWYPAQKKLEVFIGYNPPLPLNISLTINRDAVVDFSISADFPEETFKGEINNNAYLINYRQTFEKTFRDEE